MELVQFELSFKKNIKRGVCIHITDIVLSAVMLHKQEYFLRCCTCTVPWASFWDFRGMTPTSCARARTTQPY